MRWSLVFMSLLVIYLAFSLTAEAGKKKKGRKRKKAKKRNKGGDKVDFIVGGIAVPNVAAIKKKYNAVAYIEDLSISTSDKLICGCTWISTMYCITAKFCTENVANITTLRVTVRDYDRSNTNDVCQHTSGVDMKWLDNQYSTNLVILRLTSSHSDTSCHTPALMDCRNQAWASTTSNKINAIIAGWGSMSGPNDGNQNVLRMANVKAYETQPADCQTAFGSALKSWHLCAKGSTAIRGICTGDGGGPIMTTAYKVIGVSNLKQGNCQGVWSGYIDLGGTAICDFIFDTIGDAMGDVATPVDVTHTSSGGSFSTQITCAAHPCTDQADPISLTSVPTGSPPPGCPALCNTVDQQLMFPNPLITRYDRVSGIDCTAATNPNRPTVNDCTDCCDEYTCTYMCYNGYARKTACP